MNSEHRPAVSVIIPARNEGPRITTTIHSIVAGRSTAWPLQIVVVDDASSDGSCDALAHVFSSAGPGVRVDVIRLPRWSGVPYARNAGAIAARADILFMTDANVRFPPGWDADVLKRVHPNRVFCATIADEGSLFRGYGGTLDLSSMRFAWLNEPNIYRGQVPLSPCTGTILSAELFRRAGGYDTAMPVYGAAEPEFSVRLWLAGAEIFCIPELVLQHRFRPAAERRPFLEAIAFRQLQNYLRFALLYLTGANVRRTLIHYAASEPHLFRSALHAVWTGDVWTRRNVLRSRLPVSFESFSRRFGLDDQDLAPAAAGFAAP